MFVMFVIILAGCGAPPAERIDGDISTVLDRAIEKGTGTFDHRVWDELVQAHVRDVGRHFDYQGLEQEEAKFAAYLDSLAEVDLERLSSVEIEALFINAYNAYTIRSVLDRVTEEGVFELESIRDIPDVFSRATHTVGGFVLSLDNMEHNILRPLFKDPRVHFAVNCASTSCPPLPVQAFQGPSLDEQLDDVARNTLTNPDYIAVEDDTLVVTKIMDWYGGDFVNPDFAGAEDNLPAYIAKYATEAVRNWIAERGDDVPIRFRDYDWTLNRS